MIYFSFRPLKIGTFSSFTVKRPLCRLHTVSQYKTWTADYGLRTTDYGLRTTDYGLRTTDYGLRTTDYGLRTYGLRTTDYGLGIKNGLRYKTRTKHYGLSIKYGLGIKHGLGYEQAQTGRKLYPLSVLRAKATSSTCYVTYNSLCEK